MKFIIAVLLGMSTLATFGQGYALVDPLTLQVLMKKIHLDQFEPSFDGSGELPYIKLFILGIEMSQLRFDRVILKKVYSKVQFSDCQDVFHVICNFRLP